MKKKNNSKTSALDKALQLISSKYKRNPKNRLHDAVRDFLIDNLYYVQDDLKFVERELRVFGSYIDIIAKNDEKFYLIELKTKLSKYFNKNDMWEAEQLLRQKKGLGHILSLFIDKKFNFELILVIYLRDLKQMLVYSVDNFGKTACLKDFLLEDGIQQG